MTTFALIGEGPTDFAVIENVLLGWFADQEFEPEFNSVQPKPGDNGGWTEVKRSLEAGDHRIALQYNEYIVVHIDTDVCEEIGFDVPRKPPGETRDRTPQELIDAVRERLIEWMGAGYPTYADRVLFAIAVDETECWLLPVLEANSSPKRQGKTAGCLAAANRLLRKKKLTLLSTGQGKKPPAYREASKAYRKRKNLLSLGVKSPSLEVFIILLKDRDIRGV